MPCNVVEMGTPTWDQKIDHFYAHDFDDTDPEATLRTMAELVAERPPQDAAALFEWAGVHDALGFEAEALRTALHALIPTLPGYGRALTEYADALTPRN